VLLLVAGCSLPTGAGPGPRAWIDDPLDGAALDLGPVVVQSHASSESGTASAALLVNGAQVRVDNATNTSDRLASFAQPWEPAAPGDYTLEVVATDPAGNIGRSNRVVVHIGAVVITPTPPIGDVQPVPPIQPPPTFTPTATSVSSPGFRFTINANCRLGPSTAYEVVTSFYAGDLVKIEGRNEDSSWYWVFIPNSNSHCAVSASTGTVEGPLAGLVLIPAPALPALPATTVAPPPPVAPPAPGKFNVSTKSCSSSQYIVTLQWGDVKGELGYRVYRDGKLIATLPADSTGFDDTSPDYNPHAYQVEAFNDAGAAGSSVQKSSGCLY
jgi:hypothetical protein